MTPGALLAAQRRRLPHVCLMCGKSFMAYEGAKTCSSTCRSRLYRQLRRHPSTDSPPTRET